MTFNKRIQLRDCDDGRLCVVIEVFREGRWEMQTRHAGDIVFLNRQLTAYKVEAIDGL
jgi:hypothetical protein